jgi:hypothetical protein
MGEVASTICAPWGACGGDFPDSIAPSQPSPNEPRRQGTPGPGSPTYPLRSVRDGNTPSASFLGPSGGRLWPLGERREAEMIIKSPKATPSVTRVQSAVRHASIHSRARPKQRFRLLEKLSSSSRHPPIYGSTVCNAPRVARGPLAPRVGSRGAGVLGSTQEGGGRSPPCIWAGKTGVSFHGPPSPLWAVEAELRLGSRGMGHASQELMLSRCSNPGHSGCLFLLCWKQGSSKSCSFVYRCSHVVTLAQIYLALHRFRHSICLLPNHGKSALSTQSRVSSLCQERRHTNHISALRLILA